jgi:hypothetical protein
MLSQLIIDILVNRITTGGINPATGLPMKIEDIKDVAYRDAVQAELDKLNQ